MWNRIHRSVFSLFAVAIGGGQFGWEFPASAGPVDGPKLGPIEERDVTSGKAKLDPRAGYILVQMPYRLSQTFLRKPDEDTRTQYQQDWEKAFVKAQKQYERDVESWRANVAIAKAMQKKLPPEPNKPTRETFRIGSIELRDLATFGPMFVYSKGPDRVFYLTAVKPGTYIYYGPVAVVEGAGASGTCNCMGTVQLEVKPGTVTDVGNALLALPQPSPPYDVGTQLAMGYAAKRSAEGKPGPVAVPALTYGMPESLKDWPSTRAEFNAYGKINNFYGLVVTRMAPIPGILAYRRDVVINARTGADVSTPTIYTQARIKK